MNRVSEHAVVSAIKLIMIQALYRDITKHTRARKENNTHTHTLFFKKREFLTSRLCKLSGTIKNLIV
jgi:hypothetical protein